MTDAQDRPHVTTKDDGLTEKYWNPEWGDEGAAPQGVSHLDPHEDWADDDEDSPIFDELAGEAE